MCGLVCHSPPTREWQTLLIIIPFIGHNDTQKIYQDIGKIEHFNGTVTAFPRLQSWPKIGSENWPSLGPRLDKSISQCIAHPGSRLVQYWVNPGYILSFINTRVMPILPQAWISLCSVMFWLHWVPIYLSSSHKNYFSSANFSWY